MKIDLQNAVLSLFAQKHVQVMLNYRNETEMKKQEHKIVC